MNCKTFHEEGWFEKYHLGKLNDDERSILKKHLKKCIACHRKFEHETFLISGIRQVARQEIKNEIRSQVQVQRNPVQKRNWAAIMRIAAVLFILIMAPGLYLVYENSIKSTVKKNILGEADIVTSDSAVSFDERPQTISEPLFEDADKSAENEDRSDPKEERSKSDIKKLHPVTRPAPQSVKENTLEMQPLLRETDSQEKLSEESGRPLARIESIAPDKSQPDTSSKTDLMTETKKHNFQMQSEVVEPKQVITSEMAKPGKIVKSVTAEQTPDVKEIKLSSEGSGLLIRLVPVDDVSKIDQEAFPDSFTVIVTKKENDLIEMNWRVNSALGVLADSEFSIVSVTSDKIQILVTDAFMYEIRLTGAVTKARLIKK